MKFAQIVATPVHVEAEGFGFEPDFSAAQGRFAFALEHHLLDFVLREDIALGTATFYQQLAHVEIENRIADSCSGAKGYFTISASPLGLALKYRICEPSVPLVRLYSLSRVMPVTAKRFT